MALTRRKARIIALQALYEFDLTKHKPEQTLGHLLSEADLSGDNAQFIRELVIGISSNLNQIDLEIARYAPAWPVKQLAAIDRNVLRLAIFELLFDNKTPVRVVINEAVELAKNYGGENSARFVNGVLSSLSLQIKNRDSDESQEEHSGHSPGTN